MKKQTEKLQAEALKLEPKDRARLAEKLLRSLETLSDDENAELWLAEAKRRDAEMDADPAQTRSIGIVLHDARSEPPCSSSGPFRSC